MITDGETNSLFLADCLPIKYRRFFERFAKVLRENNVDFRMLPYTKDVWAVDYMPVQVDEDVFVQFTYDPDYLRAAKYRNSISDVNAICRKIGLSTLTSALVVDGGNISRSTDKVILCDKVFYENPSISKNALIKQLEDIFQVGAIIFVPWDENDFTGHADGMVRFIDNNTVLINDYSKEDARFQRSFRMALRKTGLDCLEIPYNPGSDLYSAKGLYLNFLHMENVIVMPIFGNKYDDKAVQVLELVFNEKKIATVKSNDLSKDGGVLNCITWNIKT